MSACSATYIVRCKDSDQLAIHDSLYFGTAKPNGVVSSEDWARFLENTVTPLFPRGLTSSRASGQWRNSDGETVREDSHVLQLLHPDDAPTEKAIRELVDRYKSQFQQEAVTAHTFPYVRVVLVSRFKLKQHIFKDHPARWLRLRFLN
jgi:hypothetical protein